MVHRTSPSDPWAPVPIPGRRSSGLTLVLPVKGSTSRRWKEKRTTGLLWNGIVTDRHPGLRLIRNQRGKLYLEGTSDKTFPVSRPTRRGVEGHVFYSKVGSGRVLPSGTWKDVLDSPPPPPSVSIPGEMGTNGSVRYGDRPCSFPSTPTPSGPAVRHTVRAGPPDVNRTTGDQS